MSIEWVFVFIALAGVVIEYVGLGIGIALPQSRTALALFASGIAVFLVGALLVIGWGVAQ